MVASYAGRGVLAMLQNRRLCPNLEGHALSWPHFANGRDGARPSKLQIRTLPHGDVPLVWQSSAGQTFTHLKPHEPADGDFVAELLGDLRHVFLHAHLGILFHETLIHEAVGLVKLFQNAL